MAVELHDTDMSAHDIDWSHEADIYRKAADRASAQGDTAGARRLTQSAVYCEKAAAETAAAARA